MKDTLLVFNAIYQKRFQSKRQSNWIEARRKRCAVQSNPDFTFKEHHVPSLRGANREEEEEETSMAVLEHIKAAAAPRT